MRIAHKLIPIALLAALLALPAWSVSAQGTGVTATVDRNTVGIGETLTLTIAVEGANGQPDLPPLDDFQVVGSSSSMQMQTINGATVVQSVTQYALQPLRTGELTIPAFQMVVGGQAVGNTDPIQITVTQEPSAPAQPQPGALPQLFQGGADPFDLFGLLDHMLQTGPGSGSMPGFGQMPAMPSRSLPEIAAPDALQGQDYYAEAFVDTDTPYQGEQVLYTLRLYRALENFGQIEYKAPIFTGFWSEQAPDQKDYTTQAGGRAYMVSELQHVLFPTVAGQTTIDPARFTLPGAFLGASGSEVASAPVTLNVQPLPAGAPASFQGAVGQFSMESDVNPTDVKVGDAVTQRVTISGAGNVEQITDPVWAEDAAWRAFDSKASTDSELQNGQLTGVRRIERVLVPTQAGQLTLPGAEYSYFDPAAGEYRTLASEPAVLTVAPDPNAPAAQPPAAPGQPAAAAVAVHPDLRPIKVAAASQGLVATPSLPQQPAYWALWALPVALVAGQYTWQRRQRFNRANAAALHSQRAAKQAGRALRDAEKRPDLADQAAGRILVEYLDAKLLQPVTGMTRQALGDLLLLRGVSPDLAGRVQALLTRCEAGRYAPAGFAADGSDLLAETQQVIDELEQQLA